MDQNDIDDCNEQCIQDNREKIFKTLHQASKTQLELIQLSSEIHQSMNSQIPVPKNITDQIFKMIDGSNFKLINYGLILEAYMYEIQLECDEKLFDMLLDIPRQFSFNNLLQINCDEFSIVIQYMSVLYSIVNVFKEYNDQFDNTTLLDACQFKDRGLGFMASDLIYGQVTQVNQADMFNSSQSYLNSWVVTNRVLVGLNLQHLLFKLLRQVLCESDNDNNIIINKNNKFKSDQKDIELNSDEVNLLDLELDAAQSSSIDVEIKDLKIKWYKGTILQQNLYNYQDQVLRNTHECKPTAQFYQYIEKKTNHVKSKYNYSANSLNVDIKYIFKESNDLNDNFIKSEQQSCGSTEQTDKCNKSESLDQNIFAHNQSNLSGSSEYTQRIFDQLKNQIKSNIKDMNDIIYMI